VTRALSLPAAVLIALVAAPLAGAAECTVTRMAVTVGSTGLAGSLSFATPPVFPVTVDAATGTVVFDLAGFPATMFTIVGIQNLLAFPPATVSGTLDGAGNMTVPDVPMQFTTFFGGTPTDLSVSPDVTTGIAAVTVSGADVATAGRPLDFATGAVRLRGEGTIEGAPGAGAALSAGLDVECTLAPVPDPGSLPAGPALLRAHGRVRPAKDATLGDTLALQATWRNGAPAVDAATSDVFVRVHDGDATVVLLRVPATTLAVRGKKLVASDEDGSAIHVVAGRKTNAPVGGTLTLRRLRKGYKLSLAEHGLDLTSLGTAASVTLDLGPAAAADTVTVKRKGGRVALR
jgi:hypothetical protein